jgi:hypothetical protein
MFVIEREIPKVGSKSAQELREAAAKSNDALKKLAPRIQWQHSYVASGKTVCAYLAEDASVVEEHSRLSGFPANEITEIRRTIDPTTGR